MFGAKFVDFIMRQTHILHIHLTSHEMAQWPVYEVKWAYTTNV